MEKYFIKVYYLGSSGSLNPYTTKWYIAYKRLLYGEQKCSRLSGSFGRKTTVDTVCIHFHHSFICNDRRPFPGLSFSRAAAYFLLKFRYNCQREWSYEEIILWIMDEIDDDQLPRNFSVSLRSYWHIVYPRRTQTNDQSNGTQQHQMNTNCVLTTENILVSLFNIPQSFAL